MERAASETRRIAVLTGGHGRGSNLKAIHDYLSTKGFPARIALVVGDRKTTPVKDLCETLGLRYDYIPSKDMSGFEAHLLSLCKDIGIELVALAGFLKLLSADFIEQVGIPILNIHPALIPKHCGAGMYGKRVHEAVFEAGDMFSGATIHEVDAIYDHGKVIAQTQIDISDCQSPDEIAVRVLAVEHQIYAPAILKRLMEEPQNSCKSD